MYYKTSVLYVTCKMKLSLTVYFCKLSYSLGVPIIFFDAKCASNLKSSRTAYWTDIISKWKQTLAIRSAFIQESRIL